MIAVEIDTALTTRLAGQFDDRVEIVNDDFLEMPLPAHRLQGVRQRPVFADDRHRRKLVRASNPPRDAWLVVQREAAHRFCGPPYVGESLWSLRLKPWWHVEIVDRLRRVDFDPPPAVESVLIWLSRRDRPLLDESEGRL